MISKIIECGAYKSNNNRAEKFLCPVCIYIFHHCIAAQLAVNGAQFPLIARLRASGNTWVDICRHLENSTWIEQSNGSEHEGCLYNRRDYAYA
jgi:hypothetical protein